MARPKPAPAAPAPSRAAPAPTSPPFALAGVALLVALGLGALGVHVGLASSPARTPRATPAPPAPLVRLPAAQLTTPRERDGGAWRPRILDRDDAQALALFEQRV